MSTATAPPTSPSSEPEEENGATNKKAPGWSFLAIVILFLVVGLMLLMSKCDDEKETTTGTAQTTAHSTTSSSKELLDEKDFRTTPFSSFVGWSYKVRTNGDAIWIKYNGCSEWFYQPAKESKPAPRCFKPGDADFKSAETNNPRVDVWIYEKIAR